MDAIRMHKHENKLHAHTREDAPAHIYLHINMAIHSPLNHDGSNKTTNTTK